MKETNSAGVGLFLLNNNINISFPDILCVYFVLLFIILFSTYANISTIASCWADGDWLENFNIA